MVSTANKRLAAGTALLTGILLSLSVNAAPESTASALTPSELITSASEDAQARQWQLTTAEWARYRALMQGIRGSLSLPTISPIEVLGIHARTDAERRRYAEQWARLMYQDAGRVLAFQHAYDEAVKRLFPDQPLIDPIPGSDSAPIEPADFEAGDRLMFFTTLDCSRCDALLRRLVDKRSLLPPDTSIDIYLINPDADAETADAAIRAWAKSQALPVARVRDGTITLNHDQGTWFRVTGRPLPDTLPALVHRRQDRFLPLPLSAIGSGR